MSDPISTKTQSDISKLLARSFFYRFIADLFRHPSGDAVRNRVDGYQEQWPLALDKFEEEQKTALGNLFDKLYEELAKSDESNWIREFDSVFGHTAHAPVPAYEIEYGEEHSFREPQELADISAFYSAFGLKLSGKQHERVDHVSVECEFMSYLLHKEAFALERGELENAELCGASSKRFFAEHLGKWVPSLVHKLLRMKGQGIMRAIAEFVLVYITEDALYQGIQAGPADMPVRRVVEGQETGCVSCLSKSEIG